MNQNGEISAGPTVGPNFLGTGTTVSYMTNLSTQESTVTVGATFNGLGITADSNGNAGVTLGGGVCGVNIQMKATVNVVTATTGAAQGATAGAQKGMESAHNELQEAQDELTGSLASPQGP